VFYRTPISLLLSDPIDPAGGSYYSLWDDLEQATLFRLDDGTEVTVPAQEVVHAKDSDGQSVDSPLWQLVPEEPLRPRQNYRAVFEYCGTETAFDFETGAAGSPVGSEAIDGVVYAVQLDEADFGVDELNDAFGNEGRDVLVQTELDDGMVRLTLAWSEVGTSAQDRCTATVQSTAWAWENPWFEGGAVLDHFRSSPESQDPFQGIQIGAAFGPDPERLYGVDLRLQERCHPDSSPMECIPCEFPIEGSGCWAWGALTTPTVRVAPLIQPRTWEQIAADPQCASP
jgi:hypothetical protein